MTRKDRHFVTLPTLRSTGTEMPRSRGSRDKSCASPASLGQSRNKVKARQNTQTGHIVSPEVTKWARSQQKKMKRNTPCCRVQRSAVHDMPTLGCLNMHIRVIVYGMAETLPHRSTSPSSSTPVYTGYRTGTTSCWHGSSVGMGAFAIHCSREKR